MLGEECAEGMGCEGVGGLGEILGKRKVWGVLSGMVKINQVRLINDNALWGAGYTAFSRDERNAFGSN